MEKTMSDTFIIKSGDYGLLTREGIRQLFVYGGAVTLPEGVKHVGLKLSASYLTMAELLNDAEWCEYQRWKAADWSEFSTAPRK
jgi:hypothetical protein